jgi:DnaK suppressor protein
MNPLWIAPHQEAGARAPSQAALEEYHRRLLEQRSVRLAQLAGLAADPRRRDGTPAREALAIAAREAVRDIDEALDRVDAGTYGRCTTCREAIPAERVDASLTVRLCLGCERNEQNCRVTYR